MTAYVPGLLDRLMGESASSGGAERRKDSLARELEALLNTRLGFPPGRFDASPEARASVLNYGLTDFASFCLSSSEDRAAICDSLKYAIERHEPRLRNVSAALVLEAGGVNRLHFVIHATLHQDGGLAPVNFNAVLQPSNLHYAIANERKRRWTST
jgi:type VI secretion system protein ImpF